MQAWTDVINTNLVGTINAIHVALPHLKEGAVDRRDRVGRRADGRAQQAEPRR